MGYLNATKVKTSNEPFSEASGSANFSKIGAIARINLRGDAIMLTDGEVYLLERRVDAKQLPPGTQVAIIYENRDGLPIAFSVRLLAHKFSADPRLVL